jgi:prepilin-type N-terminal cleavage/methylation domain-containing protein
VTTITQIGRTDRASTIHNTGETSSEGAQGFSLVEILIVIAILSFLVVLSGPVAGKMIRRSHGLAAYSTVRQTLAAARLQAVRRVANVVVEVSLTPDKHLRLHTFQDRANDESTPLPNDETTAAGNFLQDTGMFAGSPATDEPTFADVTLGGGIRVWKRGGSRDDVSDSVAFDSYSGDSSLVDRIVFLPTGGIAPPEAANSGIPTSTGGRGIYFADSGGRNFFRVTVASDVSGRLRVDKYVEGSGYQPSNWTWM